MIDNERRKRLIESMKKINKGLSESLTDFAENSEDSGMIFSGIKQIDKFTGGFKKCNFSILWGGESVGKSTLALQTIAHCQKEGQIACYIDMERSFDCIRAKELGVNLEELVLVSKCQTAEEALEIIRTLAKDKSVDLIILDSIQSMSPLGEQSNKGQERELASKEMAELARTLSKFFRVVAPDVYRAKIACVLIGQVRLSLGSFIVKAELSGGLALRHWAYQSIFMRRGQKSDAPSKKFKEYFIDPENKIKGATQKEECGFDTVLKLSKTKSSSSAKEGSEIHIPFLFDKGFVDTVEESEDMPIKIDANSGEERIIIENYLIEKGIFKKTEDTNIVKGSENVFKDIECQNADELLKQSEEKIAENASKKKRGRPKK